VRKTTLAGILPQWHVRAYQLGEMCLYGAIVDVVRLDMIMSTFNYNVM
jgi:hypothetical protein